MSQYQYVLSFLLADDCPTSVVEFFVGLAAGGRPEALPESDERALEASAGEVIALMAGRTHLVDRRVTLVGTAAAEEFFMPFPALAEWLARWSATQGPVGFYHQTSLAHPTLLYFSSGTPYMAQATAMPIGLTNGKAMFAEQA